MENNFAITEWCPHCEDEVELAGIMKRQICPTCLKFILPCSLCDIDIEQKLKKEHS